MKKLIFIFALVALSACQTAQAPAPEPESTVDDGRRVPPTSWYSVTLDFDPDWQAESASATELLLAREGATFKLTRDPAKELPTVGENDDKLSIAGQNYVYTVNEDQSITLETSWENDYLRIDSNVGIDEAISILETLRKSRLEYDELTFDRPSGLDWFFQDDKVVFYEDDGDFMEKEIVSVCYNEEEDRMTDCSFTAPLTVWKSDSKLSEADYPSNTFYDDVDIDGKLYQVLRFTDASTGEEQVIYVADLGGTYLWIEASDAYDDDAQDILNEVLAL